MRVAHFDTGSEWRGGQAQVLHLLRGLRERGHESVLFAPRAPLRERARSEGFVTHAWRPALEWDPIAAGSAARRITGRVDLVHCHTARAHSSGAWAARLAHLPVVVSRRVPLEVRANPLSRIKYRLGVARYLCVSRSVADALRRSGIEERRIAIVPSGVDLAPCTEPPGTDLLERLGAPAGTSLIGALGALTIEKDPMTLVDAAALVLPRFPGARFVWIGEGPLRADMEQRVRRLGLEHAVHFLGFQKDAPRLVRQLTLLALTSRFEGLGNAVLEAQAAGVPVVATAVGGVVELIEDGVNGRLVPPGDASAVAGAIADALAAPATRARWADAARVSVRRFDIARTIELTLAEYHAVLAERGQSRLNQP